MRRTDVTEVFIGIDPGKNGGIAWIDSNGTACAEKIGATPRDTCDVLRVIESFRHSMFAFIENVHAMPKQGVSSTFKFGWGAGMLHGLLTAMEIPFDTVTPSKWQKFLGCLTKSDKNVTKRKAQQLFPKLKVIHATADALLIAEYCRRVRS